MDDGDRGVGWGRGERLMAKGQPSHLAGVARLLWAGARRRGVDPSRARRAPARKLAVEREGLKATLPQLRRYLAATRADPSSADAQRLPPGFAAIWETALALELLAVEGMPFPSKGIVHLGSELVMIRPLQVGEPVRARLELERIEAHSRGALLVLRFRSWNRPGVLYQENHSRYLLPGIAPPPWTAHQPHAAAAAILGRTPSGDWREVSSWDLSAGAGLRYARASGDYNPVHLWPWSARLLGFSRPILHGHCTLAMVSHELTRATGKQPRKVSGRFRTPLELPAAVRLEVAGDLESGSVQVRLRGASSRGRPFLEGLWVGA